MARQMTARQKQNMGLGWMVFRRGRFMTFEHSGGNVGYRCRLCCSVDGPGVAVMTNSDAGETLISSLLESVLGEAKTRHSLSSGLKTIIREQSSRKQTRNGSSNQ
jgi:hypothetical protein